MRLVAVIALLLALANASAFAEGLVPQPPKGKGEHCVAATEFMRRNHMSMMKHQRDETVHEGVRGKPFSLAGCVDCHAVKGAEGAARYLFRIPGTSAGAVTTLRPSPSTASSAILRGPARKRSKARKGPFPRTWLSRRLIFRRRGHDRT